MLHQLRRVSVCLLIGLENYTIIIIFIEMENIVRCRFDEIQIIGSERTSDQL